jgi:hypothetical protein
MEITGHSTREMFDRYNTVDGDDRREAVNKLEDYFSNIDQNVDQNAISKKLTPSNMLNLGKNKAEPFVKSRQINLGFWKSLFYAGWGRRIRTPANGSREI